MTASQLTQSPALHLGHGEQQPVVLAIARVLCRLWFRECLAHGGVV